jgi:hypothetical protein
MTAGRHWTRMIATGGTPLPSNRKNVHGQGIHREEDQNTIAERLPNRC